MAKVHGLFLDIPKFIDYRLRVERHSTRRFPVLDMNGKTEIAIHHSLTRQGLSGSHAYGYSKYHVDAHGWPSIGYSYVIEPDGTIKFCNPINWRTYHVGNSNNFSIGICLTGDFRTEKPTDAQKESLRILVARLKKEYPQINRVRSHHEYPGYAWKGCCIFDYEEVLKEQPKPVIPEQLGQFYTIQEGDTFWGIAKGRDFEVIDLEKANPGVNPQGLGIGQVISIPIKASQKATEADKKAPEYHGNSIQKYLESIGEDGSYGNRQKLAVKYGIKNYAGTAAQNLQLLAILRDGKKAPSTVKVEPVKKLKVGDRVIVPARKLYAEGNAINPSNNLRQNAIISDINPNWRNSVRLKHDRGYYIGYVRLSDIGEVQKSVDQLVQEVMLGIHGDGEDRRKSLGARYTEVQQALNRRR